jgi:ElaB/YqjD/DUF883 family membrane-anchored ribosome-binding protein
VEARSFAHVERLVHRYAGSARALAVSALEDGAAGREWAAAGSRGGRDQETLSSAGGTPVDTETRPGAGRTPATDEIVEGLNDLLQLDHDALGAYDIAIEKLEDRDHADQIAGFRRDHERHVRDLNELITELGGTPANEPHATGPFKQAMQSLGALGGDKGTLIAWRTNELQVRMKYDSYASKANMWPDRVKRVVDANALDEERHYQWVADVLGRLGVGSGEGAEVHLANKARERAAQAGRTIDNVRGRVSSGFGAVTNRIAGLLETEDGETGAAAAAHRVRDVGHTVEDRVRDRPIQTLLLAGVAGFFIGRLLR